MCSSVGETPELTFAAAYAPPLGLGRSGRSSGFQTTLTYIDPGVAGICSRGGDSMKDRGKSVMATRNLAYSPRTPS